MAENCDLGDEGGLVLFYGWELDFGEVGKMKKQMLAILTNPYK